MFRRARFRPVRRAAIMDVPPLLLHANELFSIGRFEEAAAAFEYLACGAHLRGIQQDAHLSMRAGHCRLLAGQTVLGMINIKQGWGSWLVEERFKTRIERVNGQLENLFWRLEERS
ncbi:MAG: hypothetical protein FD147_2287 [Chloroflexi bacterium]|nr:MAG: hypothetical protein FD147_2287 [Chloroflexota bacterium]